MRSIHFCLVAFVCYVMTPATALGFGAVRSSILGQNAEHERITRHALACTLKTRPPDCIEPITLGQLAGTDHAYGAVTIPDLGPLASEPKAHCDRGDYLAIPSYPQTRLQARANLERCRTWMLQHLNDAVQTVGALLTANNKVSSFEVSSSLIPCTFMRTGIGRSKCKALEDFGIMLHASQDFYSHTNWADSPDQNVPIGPMNPPGLGRTVPASWLDLRKMSRDFPEGLISGCFEGIIEALYCNYDSSGSEVRVKHLYLNKDTGDIDPTIGIGTTRRGAIDGNFKRAVIDAIDDTNDKWLTLRQHIIEVYGGARGNKIICALSRDDPSHGC